ncbi:hypothetical protein DFH09DRAFT_1094633 [Mycena vulgaris]|nr:hypothetical protein DFH09DRAFT_1094633 [Mycena vulgaris]
MLPPTRPATISELAIVAQADLDAFPPSNLELKHLSENPNLPDQALTDLSGPVGLRPVGYQAESSCVRTGQAASGLNMSRLVGNRRDGGQERASDNMLHREEGIFFGLVANLTASPMSPGFPSTPFTQANRGNINLTAAGQTTAKQRTCTGKV